MDENGRPRVTTQSNKLPTAALSELRQAKLELDGYRCQLQLAGCTGTATTVHVSSTRTDDDEPVTLLDLTSCCHHCHEVIDGPRSVVSTILSNPLHPAVYVGKKGVAAVAPARPYQAPARLTPDTPASQPGDHVERNRAAWDRWAAESVRSGRERWEGHEPRWGIWGLPESEIGLLRGLEPGVDAVDLGCGSASVAAWLARAGMYPVGIDISRNQLENAGQLEDEFGLSFPLVCADAEAVPYEAESFDLAISDYGASVWCDPRRWVPEAARLLRPDGRLVFIVNSALLMACTPSDGSAAGERLARNYFGTSRVEFPDEDAVEFHLSHSEWISVLRASGFALDGLIEVQAPTQGPVRSRFAPREWATRWPSEDIWIARKER